MNFGQKEKYLIFRKIFLLRMFLQVIQGLLVQQQKVKN